VRVLRRHDAAARPGEICLKTAEWRGAPLVAALALEGFSWVESLGARRR